MATRRIIVDDQDRVIGHKNNSALTSADIYRVAALWITNSHGDLLLSQRKLTEENDPGKWHAAVAGTVEEGETYDSNIIKEMEEEIGLTDVMPLKGPKLRVSDKHNFFCQWYSLCIDLPVEAFTIQEDEVEQIKWFTRRELAAELAQNPDAFVPDFEKALKIVDSSQDA